MIVVHSVAQPGLHRAILLGFVLCCDPALTGRSFSCQCLIVLLPVRLVVAECCAKLTKGLFPFAA